MSDCIPLILIMLFIIGLTFIFYLTFGLHYNRTRVKADLKGDVKGSLRGYLHHIDGNFQYEVLIRPSGIYVIPETVHFVLNKERIGSLTMQEKKINGERVFYSNNVIYLNEDVGKSILAGKVGIEVRTKCGKFSSANIEKSYQ